MQLITNEFNRLGEVLKPSEVSKILDLDVRTVKKHAHELGGVELYPGCYRFFSNLLMDKIQPANGKEKVEKSKKNDKQPGINNKKPKKTTHKQDRHSIFN